MRTTSIHKIFGCLQRVLNKTETLFTWRHLQGSLVVKPIKTSFMSYTSSSIIMYLFALMWHFWNSNGFLAFMSVPPWGLCPRAPKGYVPLAGFRSDRAEIAFSPFWAGLQPSHADKGSFIKLLYLCHRKERWKKLSTRLIQKNQSETEGGGMYYFHLLWNWTWFEFWVAGLYLIKHTMDSMSVTRDWLRRNIWALGLSLKENHEPYFFTRSGPPLALNTSSKYLTQPKHTTLCIHDYVHNTHEIHIHTSLLSIIVRCQFLNGKLRFQIIILWYILDIYINIYTTYYRYGVWWVSARWSNFCLYRRASGFKPDTNSYIEAAEGTPKRGSVENLGRIYTNCAAVICISCKGLIVCRGRPHEWAATLSPTLRWQGWKDWQI